MKKKCFVFALSLENNITKVFALSSCGKIIADNDYKHTEYNTAIDLFILFFKEFNLSGYRIVKISKLAMNDIIAQKKAVAKRIGKDFMIALIKNKRKYAVS